MTILGGGGGAFGSRLPQHRSLTEEERCLSDVCNVRFPPNLLCNKSIVHQYIKRSLQVRALHQEYWEPRSQRAPSFLMYNVCIIQQLCSYVTTSPDRDRCWWEQCSFGSRNPQCSDRPQEVHHLFKTACLGCRCTCL